MKQDILNPKGTRATGKHHALRTYALFSTMIMLTLSLCACTDSGRKDTGGDTNVGGLFWDILHGVRGDMEQEDKDITNPVLPENCEKEGETE